MAIPQDPNRSTLRTFNDEALRRERGGPALDTSPMTVDGQSAGAVPRAVAGYMRANAQTGGAGAPAAPVVRARMLYNPSSGRIRIGAEEFDADFDTLRGLGEVLAGGEIPEQEYSLETDGYVPMEPEALLEAFSAVEPDTADTFVSSIKQGIGLLGSSITSLTSDDDPSNEWSRAGEEAQRDASLAERVALDQRFYESGAAFNTGLKSLAGNLTSTAVGAGVGALAGGPVGAASGGATAGGVAFGAGMAGGEQAVDAYPRLYAELEQMSPEDRASIPAFAQALREGLSEVDAARRVAAEGARMSMAGPAAVGALETYLGARVLGIIKPRLPFLNAPAQGATGSAASRIAGAIGRRGGRIAGIGLAEGITEGYVEPITGQMGADLATGLGTQRSGESGLEAYGDFEQAVAGAQFGLLGIFGGGANAQANSDAAANVRASELGAAATASRPPGTIAGMTPNMQDTAGALGQTPAFGPRSRLADPRGPGGMTPFLQAMAGTISDAPARGPASSLADGPPVAPPPEGTVAGMTPNMQDAVGALGETPAMGPTSSLRRGPRTEAPADPLGLLSLPEPAFGPGLDAQQGLYSEDFLQAMGEPGGAGAQRAPGQVNLQTPRPAGAVADGSGPAIGAMSLAGQRAIDGAAAVPGTVPGMTPEFQRRSGEILNDVARLRENLTAIDAAFESGEITEDLAPIYDQTYLQLLTQLQELERAITPPSSIEGETRFEGEQADMFGRTPSAAPAPADPAAASAPAVDPGQPDLFPVGPQPETGLRARRQAQALMQSRRGEASAEAPQGLPNPGPDPRERLAVALQEAERRGGPNWRTSRKFRVTDFGRAILPEIRRLEKEVGVQPPPRPAAPAPLQDMGLPAAPNAPAPGPRGVPMGQASRAPNPQPPLPGEVAGRAAAQAERGQIAPGQAPVGVAPAAAAAPAPAPAPSLQDVAAQSREAVSDTTSEGLEALKAQFAAVQTGDKVALFLTPEQVTLAEEEIIGFPPELSGGQIVRAIRDATKAASGTTRWPVRIPNPDGSGSEVVTMTPGAAQMALDNEWTDDVLAQVLDYSESKADAMEGAARAGADPVAVVARDEAGNEVQSQLATPERPAIAKAKAAVRRNAPKAAVEVTTPQAVQEARAQTLSREEQEAAALQRGLDVNDDAAVEALVAEFPLAEERIRGLVAAMRERNAPPAPVKTAKTAKAAKAIAAARGAKAEPETDPEPPSTPPPAGSARKAPKSSTTSAKAPGAAGRAARAAARGPRSEAAPAALTFPDLDPNNFDVMDDALLEDAAEQGRALAEALELEDPKAAASIAKRREAGLTDEELPYALPLSEGEVSDLVDALVDQARIEADQIRAKDWDAATSAAGRMLRAMGTLGPGTLPALDAGQMQGMVAQLAAASDSAIAMLKKTHGKHLSGSLEAKRAARGAVVEVGLSRSEDRLAALKTAKRAARATESNERADKRERAKATPVDLASEAIDLDGELDAADGGGYDLSRLRVADAAPTLTRVESRVSTSAPVPRAVAQTLQGWVDVLERSAGRFLPSLEVMTVAEARRIGAVPMKTYEGFYLRHNDNGVVRHIIAIDDRFLETESPTLLELLAHEFGHVVDYALEANAPLEVQEAIEAAFQRWHASQVTATNSELLLQHFPPLLARHLAPGVGGMNRDYLSSRREWVANQIGRWHLTDARPVSVVDRFFAKLARILRWVWETSVEGARAPDAEIAALLDHWVTRGRIETKGMRAAAAQRRADMLAAEEAGKVLGIDGIETTAPPVAAAGVRMNAASASARAAMGPNVAEAARDLLKVATGSAPGTLRGAASDFVTALRKTNLGDLAQVGLLQVTTLETMKRMYGGRGEFGKALRTYIDTMFLQQQDAHKAAQPGVLAAAAATNLAPKEQEALFDVMYEATTSAMHPDATNLKDPRNAHVLEGAVGYEARTEAKFQRLRAKYEALSPDGQAAYRALRDAFVDLNAKKREAQLQAVLDAAEVSPGERDLLAAEFRGGRIPAPPKVTKGPNAPKPPKDPQRVALEEARQLLRDLSATMLAETRGPYFPLGREGEWIMTVSLPSRILTGKNGSVFQSRKEAAEFVRSMKPLLPHARFEVSKIEDDGDGPAKFRVYAFERGVYFFDSYAEAQAALPDIEADIRQSWADVGVDGATYDAQVAPLIAEGDLVSKEPVKKADYYESLMNAVPPGYLQRLQALRDSKKISERSYLAMREIYLESLPEFSYKKSLLRRENVRGASRQMLQSYTARLMGASHDYASTLHSRTLREAWSTMHDNRAGTTNQNVLNALHQHNQLYVERVKDSTYNTVSGVVTDASSIFSLGFSVPYTVMNMLQPLMVGTSVLAGLRRQNGGVVGATRAVAALAEAYKGGKASFFTKRGLQEFVAEARLLAGKGTGGPTVQDLSQQIIEEFGRTPQERALLQHLLDRGRLDFAFLNTVQDAASSALGSKWRALLRMGMAFPQQVEAMNRVVTALAAYRLATEEGGLTGMEAIEVAESAVIDTNLDYSRMNRPILFNKPGWNIILQFRQYMLGMYTLMARSFAMAVSSDPEARKQGRTVLGVFLLTHASVAGVAGLGPVYFVAKTALGLGAAMGLYGDEEDEFLDDEQLMRKYLRAMARDYLGAPDMADTVLDGMPTMAGVNLRDKLGIPVLLDPRFMGVSERDNAGNVVDKTLLTMLGAPYANGKRVLNGLEAAAEGDVQGAARGLPASLRSVATSWLAANDGLLDAQGDVLVAPEEYQSLDGVLRALGVPLVSEDVLYRERNDERQVNARINERRAALLERYRTADVGERMRLRREVADFNRTVPRQARLDPDDLQRSVRAKAQRESGQPNAAQRTAREILGP